MTQIETAIILATDLVGSTELATRVGGERFEELRHEHDSILGDAIEDAGGRVIKNTGDGLLASFPSVTAALAAGVAIQQHLERRRRTAEIALSVRVGISIGDAALDDGDYFGIPPIEATRLCAQARGGEILMADAGRAMLRDRGGHRFEATEPLELKGLPDPVTAWRVGWDPLPPAAGATLPARLLGPAETAYVGRAAEQAVLRDRWDRAAEGRRQTVLISGEPGIGKTRLVVQAVRTALPGDAVVLYGRCDEDQGVPYHPWLEILRDYVASAPRRLLRPHAAELARLVPEVSRKLGSEAPPPPASTDPDTERYLLFNAVGALLAAAAEKAPLLVFLDDLHWADRPTLQLLRYLVSASASGRLMLLGTFRDSDLGPEHPLGPMLADLRREPAVTRVGLSGLEPADIVDLIEVTAGHQIDGGGARLAAQVHRETAGNPFFVGEMLRHLRETGAISVGAGGRWSFAGDPDAAGLPQSVREVIGRRVRRLDADARLVLSAAAVVGPELDVELLARITDEPARDVLDLLDQAVDAALVTRTDPATTPIYAFSHGLVQTTLYEALPAGRRVGLHRAVGLAIEALHGDRAERLPELAHHFLEAAVAGEAERAADYARRAGQQAMAQFAYDEAAGLFRRGLAVTPAARPHERIALLQGLGEAQLRAGDADAARATLLEAADAARRHDEPEALARATLACGIWGLSFGVDHVLVELAEESIARLDAARSPGLLAQVKGLLGAALYFAPPAQAERRHRLCAEAVALARAEHERAGDREAAVSLAYVLARSLLADWGPDSTERDIECAELLGLCQEVGHMELELLVRNWRTTVLLERGDFAAVDRELARVEHMAGALRQPRAMVYLPLHRGMTVILKGHLAEAERLNAEYPRIGARLGLAAGQLAATAQLLVIRLLQGRLPELEPRLRALAEAHPHMAALRCALVMTSVQAGRLAQARAEFEAMTADGLTRIPPDNTRIVALALLAEAAARFGDRRRGRALYDALSPYSGRWVVSPTAAGLWPVDRSLGQAAGAAGATDAALAHLAAARALAQPCAALPTLALTALDEARLLAARGAPGDAERVRALTGEAAALAAELGMGHVAAEAAALDAGSPGAVAAR